MLMMELPNLYKTISKNDSISSSCLPERTKAAYPGKDEGSWAGRSPGT